MANVSKDNAVNPVVMTIGGVEIRKENSIRIKLNEHEYARFTRISMVTGASVSKLVALSCQPCPICGNDHIEITIPLGLLSTKKQASWGNTKKYRKHEQ